MSRNQYEIVVYDLNGYVETLKDETDNAGLWDLTDFAASLSRSGYTVILYRITHAGRRQPVKVWK